LETKAYIVYYYMIFRELRNMDINSRNEEIRWQVIKAMLDEFPTLKERIKNYLKK